MYHNLRWDIEEEIKNIALSGSRYFGAQVMLYSLPQYSEKEILRTLFYLSADGNHSKIKLQLDYVCPVHKNVLFSQIDPPRNEEGIITYMNYQFKCIKCKETVQATPETTYIGFIISDEYFAHVKNQKSIHTLRNFKS